MEEKKTFRLTDLVNDDEILKFTDFENFLNVYQDSNNYYHFNLNSTLYIDVPPSKLKTYVCQHDLHWPTISYNIYGTVRLAWLLMKLNGITADISFKIISAGSQVKYLDKSDLTTVIDAFTKK